MERKETESCEYRANEGHGKANCAVYLRNKKNIGILARGTTLSFVYLTAHRNNHSLFQCFFNVLGYLGLRHLQTFEDTLGHLRTSRIVRAIVRLPETQKAWNYFPALPKAYHSASKTQGGL